MTNDDTNQGKKCPNCGTVNTYVTTGWISTNEKLSLMIISLTAGIIGVYLLYITLDGAALLGIVLLIFSNNISFGENSEIEQIICHIRQ